MLKLRAPIPEQTISAIRYLVSNAVEGLTPEAVSIVDTKGELLGKSKQKTSDDESSEAALDYRRNVEKDLLAKINTTLEPLLGPERFRSSVAAECDFSSGELSEETYDPERQAIVSDQRSKETTSAGATNGIPGTQSNLPRATPRPGTNTQVTRETQSTSYQTTRTVKRTKLPQGSLKRLSVSVLLDQTPHWEGRGPTLRRVLTPPTPETLNRITEVVSAAAGIIPERGDRLVVDSLPFESTRDEQPPAALREQAPAQDPPDDRQIRDERHRDHFGSACGSFHHAFEEIRAAAERPAVCGTRAASGGERFASAGSGRTARGHRGPAQEATGGTA